MNSKDFVIAQIDILTEKFPQIRCRYEYEDELGAHYLEIIPLDSFIHNHALNTERRNIFRDFVSAFPFETLSFFSEGDLLEIENVTYERSGFMYGLVAVSQHCNYYEGVFGSLLKKRVQLKLESSYSFRQKIKKHEQLLNSASLDEITVNFPTHKSERELNEFDILRYYNSSACSLTMFGQKINSIHLLLDTTDEILVLQKNKNLEQEESNYAMGA